MKIRSSISAVTALSGLILAAAAPALALPPAESSESITLIYHHPFTLSAVGPGAADVLNVPNAVGCGGVCSATTTLGGNPSITLQLDQTVVPGDITGNFAFAELAYFIQANGVPMGTPVDGMLHASQNFSSNIQSAGGEAQVAIFFGPANADPNFTLQGEGLAPYPAQYQDTYCLSYCESSFANFGSPAAMPASQPVVMEAGIPYVVELVDELVANPHVFPLGTQLSASIDPTFTTTTPGVTFSFSPGVTGATGGVPEPASWAMMVLGLASIGGALRAARDRGRPSVAAA
jgi:hypothetical protein